MRGGLSALVAAALVTTLASGTACDAVFRPAPRWNVLVIVPDTIRGDHISTNGYFRKTPALEALAADGVNFTQAITVAPRTWQSFSSILTGLHPPSHGVRYIYDDPIASGIPTMASLFRDRGYQTAAFEVGRFLEEMTTGEGAFDTFVRARLTRRHRNVDDALLERTYHWLHAKAKDGPWLAFVKTTGGHWPYDHNAWLGPDEACKDHDHAFNRGSYGLKRTPHGHELVDEDAWRRAIWTLDPDERSRRHRIAHYDSEVRETDFLIGVLLERLRKGGLLERTIVVVTSDHGESLGEHGYLQHGPRVDEPVMHVPLLVWLPEGHPDRHPGLRVDSLVRVVDILPTVLELAGYDPPEGLEGTSLVPRMRGEAAAALVAYGETGRAFGTSDPDGNLPGIAGKRRMIRTERFKLEWIPREGGHEVRLYDLAADPEERDDVAAQHPDEVAELTARLLPTLSADAAAEDAGQELTESQRENLRALGYLE